MRERRSNADPDPTGDVERMVVRRPPAARCERGSELMGGMVT